MSTRARMGEVSCMPTLARLTDMVSQPTWCRRLIRRSLVSATVSAIAITVSAIAIVYSWGTVPPTKTATSRRHGI